MKLVSWAYALVSLALISLLMTCVDPAPAFGLDVLSTRLDTAPRVDGRIDFREWPLPPGGIEFDHGFILVGNDRTRLHLLVDVLGDTAADPRNGSSEGDWIEVFVDMDANGAITPNVDRIYTLLAGSYDLRMQKYASSDGVRNPPEPERTYSSVAVGFGCFAGDGTQVLYTPPLAPTCANHRVWEIAIDLDEIGQDPSALTPSLYGVKVGVLVHSETPGFSDEIPDGFLGDFGRMLDIELASVPPVIADRSAEIQFDQEDTDENGDGVVNDPIEVTQAVQTRGNTLRLVARKDTAARVYVEVQEGDAPQLVTVWLYGVRDGHDLPGSPLAGEVWAQPDAEFPVRVLATWDDVYQGSGVRYGRDNLDHTANFLLPEAWTAADGVTFEARGRFLNQEIASRAVDKYFYRRTRPFYIVIPINEGTTTYPVKPSDEDLAAAESYIRTVYPVPDIDFMRMEYTPFDIAPQPVDGAILRAYILEELIRFYNSLVGLGVDPLPDQIFGYTATSEWGSAAKVTPLCTAPGCGHVAGGNTYPDLPNGRRDYGYNVMAHEIDHNIGDPDTWGSHVPGGSADPSSVDPEWMRLWEESEGDIERGYSDSDIREFGFDTRLPWANGYDLLEQPYTQRRFTVVPPYFEEFMGYRSTYVAKPGGAGSVRVHPTQWISPYRWERMFDVFSPTPPMRAHRTSAYVSGRVFANGAAVLDPTFVLLGEPQVVPDPAGTHALTVHYRGMRLPLEVRFTPRFVEEDGTQLDASAFHFNVPLLSGITRITLRQGKKVLDDFIVSQHHPMLKITAPSGKTQWNGRQVVRWDATDKDGDALHYAILYSPNGGKRWVPIAWGVEGNEYAVNMDLLPGGDGGKFKIVSTDGLNTVSTVSQGSLSVADKPPTASIVRPAASGQFQPPCEVQLQPGWVTFEASGSDLEDGVLRNRSFLWFYGKQRASLGRGRRITAHLESGVHLITLVAVDSAGNSAERTMPVTVGQQQCDAS